MADLFWALAANGIAMIIKAIRVVLRMDSSPDVERAPRQYTPAPAFIQGICPTAPSYASNAFEWRHRYSLTRLNRQIRLTGKSYLTLKRRISMLHCASTS